MSTSMVSRTLIACKILKSLSLPASLAAFVAGTIAPQIKGRTKVAVNIKYLEIEPISKTKIITKAIAPNIATTLNSLGKIVLKKGLAWLGSSDLKTEGATIAVWNIIIPEIIPEIRITNS